MVLLTLSCDSFHWVQHVLFIYFSRFLLSLYIIVFINSYYRWTALMGSPWQPDNYFCNLDQITTVG